MRMKLLSSAIAAALCGGVASYADPLVEISEGITTPIAGARVETFDDRKSAHYSGAGRAVVGSIPGSTAPDGDNTAYYSVKPVAAAFVAEPGVSYNYFGLYWGTIDEYNELRFFRDGRLIATVTGRDVLRLIAARGTARPGLLSCYVNVYFGAQTYTRIEFRTSWRRHAALRIARPRLLQPENHGHCVRRRYDAVEHRHGDRAPRRRLGVRQIRRILLALHRVRRARHRCGSDGFCLPTPAAATTSTGLSAV